MSYEHTDNVQVSVTETRVTAKRAGGGHFVDDYFYGTNCNKCNVVWKHRLAQDALDYAAEHLRTAHPFEKREHRPPKLAKAKV